jgi:nucleoside-diphosphate-sugar epimerase
MRRALIVGCGYTGTALARRLSAEAISVVGTTASPQPAEGFEHRLLDLLKPTALELPEAADAVVYYMVPTLHRDYDGKERPHLRPMQRCLEALATQPLRGLVYLSSTSVYGDRRGGWVDEDTPPTPRSPWGRMRAELEQAVWTFGSQQGVPACVTRLPEIYGPRRGPQERLRQGQKVLRNPEGYSNRIHVDDLVTVLAELGARLDQRLLLVSDDKPTTREEVYRFAAKTLGYALLRPDDAPLGPGADVNRRALLEESRRCRNNRLRLWLGGPLRYPSYREGITAILAAERRPD